MLSWHLFGLGLLQDQTVLSKVTRLVMWQGWNSHLCQFVSEVCHWISMFQGAPQTRFLLCQQTVLSEEAPGPRPESNRRNSWSSPTDPRQWGAKSLGLMSDTARAPQTGQPHRKLHTLEPMNIGARHKHNWPTGTANTLKSDNPQPSKPGGCKVWSCKLWNKGNLIWGREARARIDIPGE